MMLSFPNSSRDRFPRHLLVRYWTDDRGEAVEFALLALPFFGLLFAIIQVSLAMFANQALQTTVSKASRQIMTGEIQMAGTGINGFRAALCSNSFLFDCDQLMIQVEGFGSDFGSADPTRINPECLKMPADEEEKAQIDESCWKPGGPQEVTLVRVSYKWPLGVTLEDFGKGTTLVAISAFYNEPYN